MGRVSTQQCMQRTGLFPEHRGSGIRLVKMVLAALTDKLENFSMLT